MSPTRNPPIMGWDQRGAGMPWANLVTIAMLRMKMMAAIADTTPNRAKAENSSTELME